MHIILYPENSQAIALPDPPIFFSPHFILGLPAGMEVGHAKLSSPTQLAQGMKYISSDFIYFILLFCKAASSETIREWKFNKGI